MTTPTGEDKKKTISVDHLCDGDDGNHPVWWLEIFIKSMLLNINLILERRN